MLAVAALCQLAPCDCWVPLQTAYTIPILAFAFVCHPEVLPIYTELRKYVLHPFPRGTTPPGRSHALCSVV